MGEEDKGKRAQSLGWLTESTIMPKKHKAIEGVGASSILELKAELYKSQEHSKKSKELDSNNNAEYHRARRRIVSNNDPFSRKNSGVEARENKDKLAFKAVNDGAASYSALEKKAELYEKLVRGELSDEEDKEKYCVDFFRKSYSENEGQDSQNNIVSAGEVPIVSAGEVPEKENEDDGFIPFSLKPMGLGRTAGTVDLDEHKRFVKEVHQEANQAREKVSELKLRRQQQAAAHREKLKQAYLKKKLEKLKASSAAKPEQT